MPLNLIYYSSMENIKIIQIEETYTPYSDDDKLVDGISPTFDKMVGKLSGEQLEQFFFQFDFNRLDHVACSRSYELPKAIILWKTILLTLEDDLDTALNNMEISIEDDVGPGISAWGNEYDYLLKKKKEYEELLEQYS
jgi:hypothetical protein